jgi:hypothetical protein
MKIPKVMFDQKATKRASGKPIIHGERTTYASLGCRCKECKRAQAVYQLKWYWAKKKAKPMLPQNPTRLSMEFEGSDYDS